MGFLWTIWTETAVYGIAKSALKQTLFSVLGQNELIVGIQLLI